MKYKLCYPKLLFQSSFEYITFAAISKIFAASITYPYQVVRSRLQDQHRNYSGVLDVVRQTWRWVHVGYLALPLILIAWLQRVMIFACTYAVNNFASVRVLNNYRRYAVSHCFHVFQTRGLPRFISGLFAIYVARYTECLHSIFGVWTLSAVDICALAYNRSFCVDT